jgi:hypothetical protein
MHHCPHCQRSYQRKVYFERHVALCEILSKSKKERTLESQEEADTPSVRDLYRVVMELTLRYTQLEQKYQEMAKLVQGQKQHLKRDILVQLNANTASDTGPDFMTWLKNITVTRQHLEYLFQMDYAKGVVLVVQDHLQEEKEKEKEKAAMQAFAAKDNAFYIYHAEQKKWILMDDVMYIKLMHTVDKKFMSEFVKWQTENKAKMYEDDFSLMYAKNVKKIMVIREPLYSRIKRDLYRTLKPRPPASEASL